MLTQIRLDHWLNANTALAVGTTTGLAPSLESEIRLGVSAGPPGRSIDMHHPIFPAEPDISLPQPRWTDEQDVSFQTMVADMDFGGERGIGPISAGPVVEIGKSDDEYWNALIDGELFGVT